MELEKGAVIFNRVIRGDLDNGGTLVSRPKWREGGRDVVIFRKRVPIRGKKMCQFPEAGVCLAQSEAQQGGQCI